MVFNDPILLEQALTHRSAKGHGGSFMNYERLEFLGDAILEQVVVEHLVTNYAEKEGMLAGWKDILVSNKLILNWTSPGQLQSAPAVTGVYANITPAPSPPYTSSITQVENRFFRLLATP